MIDGTRFELSLAKKLAEAGVEFQLNPTIRGLRPDFLIEADGKRTVVEAKSWNNPSPKAIRIAIKQAQYYQMAAKADEFFVVIQGLKHSRPSKRILTENDLIARLKPEKKRREATERILSILKALVEQKGRADRVGKKSRKERTIFASMPFQEKYMDTYFNAIVAAAKSVDALPDRADYDEYSGDIVQHIQRQIRDSVAIVADLSEARPNVLYEIGYAAAIDKKVIQISSSSLTNLPLSVRNNNTIPYSIGNTHRLKSRLKSRLKKVLTYSK
jgi:hypothetical protein